MSYGFSIIVTEKMILFYSEFCQHCRMLIETIKRHDSKNIVKMVCIEGLKKIGKSIPSQIHSVPALLIMQTETKSILFGKQVFDYLLAPGSGRLLSVQSTSNSINSNSINEPINNSSEPMAFVLGGGSSDMFSIIEDVGSVNDKIDIRSDRNYNWVSLEEITTANTTTESPLQEETRKKQELPDIDMIRARRDLELNENYINVNALNPPSFTRP